MDLDTLMAYGRAHSFNDIEWFDEPQPVDKDLLGSSVDGLTGFAEHGSGSVYATFQGRVFWIDSEGEQYAIAGSIDEFVDALHYHAGSLYDAMSACQGASYVAPAQRAKPTALRNRFGATWCEAARVALRNEYEAYEAFCAWAKQHGRGPALDLVDRLVALRPAVDTLRALAAPR